MTELCEIVKLAELLNPKKKDNSDDEEDEFEKPTVKDLHPENFDSKPSANEKNEEKMKKDEKNDEELDPEEEVLRFLENENREISDWRKTPQWDISYGQQLTPSDVFLQMGGKTPATASCENMIISVYLPGEKRQNIDLKIMSERLNLFSPRFRLDVPLPHRVNPQKGNAQFNSESEKLTITLQMNREFDYINF